MRPLILAVEPDERTRSLLEVGFAEQGFTLVTAASAEEAQGYLRPEWMLPSMIFCEADLRGLDGFTLCGQIRADARTTDLPVVLLSKTPDAVHREMAGGAGADQLLPKPLFLNDLVAMARLMAGRGSVGGRYEADTVDLPLAQALRALLSGVRSGRLDFHPGPAWISFREGQAVDAAYEGLRGDEALRRMLLLARGKYVVTFGPTLSAATMTFGVEELCGPAYARFQRWEELIEAGLSLDAVWTIDFGALEMALPGLAPEVTALVHRFDGRRPLREVLLKSLMDELLALEAVGRLVGMGVLVPQDRGSEAAQGASRVRALFQPAAAQQGDETETALTADPGSEEGQGSSLYESTDTLDRAMLQQLSAFRIRPVVEHVETVPASPELTAFVQHVERPAPEEEAPSAASQPGADARMLDDMGFGSWPPKEDVSPPPPVAAPETVEASIAGAIEDALGEIAASGIQPPEAEEGVESIARALEAELEQQEREAQPAARIEPEPASASASESPPVAAAPEDVDAESPEAWRAPEPSAPIAPPLPTVVISPSFAAEARAVEQAAPVAPPLPTVVVSPSLAAEVRELEVSPPVAPPIPTVVVSSSLSAEARALESPPQAPSPVTVVVSPRPLVATREVHESAPPAPVVPAATTADSAAPAPASAIAADEPARAPRRRGASRIRDLEVVRFEPSEPPPSRQWLLAGVVSTALVALLAAAAVVVNTRSPDWIAARVYPFASLLSGSQPASRAATPAKETVQQPRATAAPAPAVVPAAATTAPAAGAPAPATPTPAPTADSAGQQTEGTEALARGIRLYETGRQREAIRVLEVVTRDYPTIASGWVYLGMAKFDRNDRAGAERAAKKALEIDPRNGRALVLLATVYLDSGNTQKARTHLRRYLELYPNGQFAREARQLLGRR